MPSVTAGTTQVCPENRGRLRGPEFGDRVRWFETLQPIPMPPTCHRILCPLDFSEISRHVLDHAAGLARWYGATIEVLYVHRVSVPLIIAAPVPFVGPSPLDAAERSAILQAMAEFVADDRAAGIAVDTLVEEDHDITGAIVRRAKATSADVIVLGTHGRTGFERLVLGSVAEKVLRKAGCPVLTVPPQTHPLPQRITAVQRIVCPIDFSTASAGALRLAASLSRQSGARITVVHIVELPPDVPEPPLPEFLESRTVRFRRAHAAMLEAVPPRIRATCAIDELLLAGKPYREILRLASEQQADLIVMGVHGRGVVDRLFFGSTTQHVVRQATCPVFTVRDVAH